MATQPGGSVTSRAASETRSGPPGSSSGVAGATGNSSGGNTSSTQTGAKFRHGLLQLMIHTIDPLHDVNTYSTQMNFTFVFMFCLLISSSFQYTSLTQSQVIGIHLQLSSSLLCLPSCAHVSLNVYPTSNSSIDPKTVHLTI
uniref:Uncharacterized protein n=1 Tax=Glossina austeni TaxID=7395 RepID=A0A1A9V8A9_GLOAU